ncbi:MAG TPA: prepilin peptidase [Candidatus Saccharimonadales bacterium]|jgi:prepilin signal peptidase PulO-like enzyme (type II secretory pathway)|nr:prepilin peptidase [Candidatus Saccharimonadales bacterium]
MVLMIIVILVVVGLCLGSFVNALVWRLHEQGSKKAKSKKLSILNGRSMCPHCRHELAAKDLVPVFSWLALKGKCRYCGKPISTQYPAVELATALLFVASYAWWPEALKGAQVAVFILWLLLLVGLMALLVYDLRWLLLPDRIVYPLSAIAVVIAVINIASANRPAMALVDVVLAVAIGGGIFYLIFQMSGGKWIGGGDVKLGWLLGLVAGTPGKAVLFIFLASLLGSLVSLPLLMSKKLKRSSVIPFGPFLIVGVIVTVLFGSGILNWYRQTFIDF